MSNDQGVSPRERKSATYGDLLRTLVIFIAAIGLFLLLLPRHHHSALHPVDYSSDLSIFAHGASFPAVVPSPVPTGWTVTSFSGDSTTTPETLHMGMVTADKKYADLEESTGSAASLVTLDASSAPVVGTEPIAGVIWQRYEKKGVISLTLTAHGFTTLLTGGASLADLRLLASSLQPALP